MGGYRLEAGKDSRRIAISSLSSIDEFLDRVSDDDIARFAGLFSDAAAVAVLRRLVYGKQTVIGLVEQTGMEEDRVVAAIDHLADAGLASRNGDGEVEPLTDTATYFLTLLSAAHLHGANNGTPRYGDALSRDIVVRAARGLAENIPRRPPIDRFAELSETARLITLFQAIPLSLSAQQLADLKAGAQLVGAELNDAQLDYLQTMLEELRSAVTDPKGVTIRIDPTHTGDDDHAHIVVSSGDHDHHIDAFLQDTSRPGWY